MLRNLFAILPLLVAAPITAQTVDIELVGDEHAGRQAMTLDLGAKASEAKEGSVRLGTKGGKELAPVIVLVGLEPCYVDLDIIGIDGVLLADPVATTAPSYFDGNGESSLTFPLNDRLTGMSFTMQAASLWFNEEVHIALSNGIVLTFGR